MKISRQSTKTLLAAAFVLAFSASALAAEAGGDRGPNNMNPRANDSTSYDTRMNSGEDMKMRGQRYNDSVSDARRDYDGAMVNCRDVERGERAGCRREARLSRDQALAEAREHRNDRYYRDGVNVQDGSLPPGGRTERRDSSTKP